MKQRFRRYCSLIMLGCALCMFAPVIGATSTETIIGPSIVFGSPSPSPQPTLCPTVSVSCPSEIGKQPITFEAMVTGGDPNLKTTYTYTWSVSV